MKCIKKNAVHRGQDICKGAKMDEQNNFDDIILDKGNKSEKLKKLLLRIIALAILFLVVLITMKLLSGNDTEQNTLSPLPEEPTDTFTNIPPTQATNGEVDEFEELRRIMRGSEEDNNSAVENNQSFTMPLPSSEYNATIAPSEPEKPKQADKPAADKPAKKPDDKPKPSQKPSQKPADKPAASADKLSAGTYVQVFSVEKFDAKSKELALIEKNGFKYKLYKTKVGGKDITRVLVGPFAKDELNEQLKKIQETIRKDAFTFQVK